MSDKRPTNTKTYGMTPGARRALRRHMALMVVLIVAVGLMIWRSTGEGDRTRAYFDRRICKIAERLYLPPASTDDGRRRQVANRQFAKDILGCTPPDERR